MALGDGIRRNIAHVDPAERAMLRDAIIELHHRFFPGSRSDTPPGGVSWWFKQDEIHQATHVHGGPEFLPWHRELTNRFEELLRQINPQLSLHYWDFRDDPRNIPSGNIGGGATGNVNLFDSDFMGSSSGSAGDPWLSAGFYDPQAGTAGHPPDRDFTDNPVDPPSDIPRTRSPLVPGSPPQPYDTTNQSDAIGVNNGQAFPQMRADLENLHNGAHGYYANVSPHNAFRDPFVFLLHSNVDRIYAQWQTDPAHPDRLSEATVYGAESNLDVPVPDLLGNTQIQNLTHLVEPWSTGVQISENRPIRPWEPTHENQGVPHTYHDISLIAPPCYDTNGTTFRIDEVENPLNASTNRFQVIFNDVPEGETTWRAAVIRIFTCEDTTFRVKPGTEPSAPFGVAVGQASALHGAHPHLFQELRIWFQYTAGAVGTAGPSGHDDGPVNTTIRCDETDQEFQLELRAHYIHRPTVAVQMVLDQSGSMSDPAGTSGLTRLTVLKDAANLFATVIQDNNGLGIIRFDQDAYPPNDPTFGGMVITKITSDADRDTAHNTINAHGAHGATSVGDGLIMGHAQIAALPPGAFDNAALLLLTDGLENQPASIADAIGAGATDNRTFAIGLGNEFQVNTGALNAIAGSTGGNLLLSGVLTSGTDDFFRVKKFFLQILAAVTNTSIVRDPTGYINSGTRVKVPFNLSEADIDCRVILLTDYPVVTLAIEAPDGTIIDEGNAAAHGVTFKTDNVTKTASFELPLAFQAQNLQAGTWNAVLEIDKPRYKRELSILADKDPQAAGALRGKGAQYCVSAHSFSNLRMTADVSQAGYAPGSTLTLRAKLTEYRIPVENRARVRAEVQYPDNSHGVVSLAEIQPGTFEGQLVGNQPGIYRFNVIAEGATYHGAAFTREQLLNAALFIDGQIQPPPIGTDPGDRDSQLCQLFMCLLKNEALRRYFAERGLQLDAIAPCFERYCKAITAHAPTGEIEPTERRDVDEALASPRWSDIELLREASQTRAAEPPPA
jgi:hypothetical protein